MGQKSFLLEKSDISNLPEVVQREVKYPSVKDKVHGMTERKKIGQRLVSAFQIKFEKLEGIDLIDPDDPNKKKLTPSEMAYAEFGAYLKNFPYHLTGEEILEAYRMASRGELRDFAGNQIQFFPTLSTAQAGKILMAYQEFKVHNQQHTLGMQKLKRLINPEIERTPEEAKAEKRKNWEALMQAVKENKPCDHAFLFYELVLKKGGLKKFVSDPVAQKTVIKKKMFSILRNERMKKKSAMFNQFEIKYLNQYFQDPKEFLHQEVKFTFDRLQALATTLIKNDLVYGWIKKQIKKGGSKIDKS